MKEIILVVVFLVISGCATNQAWHNPTKTMEEGYRDLAECESMANSAGSSQMVYGGGAGSFQESFIRTHNVIAAREAELARERIFGNCMMGRGWRLVNKNP